MRPEMHKILTLLAFLFLAGSLTYLIYTFSTFMKASAPVQTPVSQSNSNQAYGGDYYTGLVEKLVSPIDSLATHSLVDSSGKVTAYLESSQIDLGILEGFRASVHGFKERILKDGVPIIRVDKVSFK